MSCWNCGKDHEFTEVDRCGQVDTMEEAWMKGQISAG